MLSTLKLTLTFSYSKENEVDMVEIYIFRRSIGRIDRSQFHLKKEVLFRVNFKIPDLTRCLKGNSSISGFEDDLVRPVLVLCGPP